MQVKEDISIQSPDAENGYLFSQGHDDETYVLGQTQKQMLLDAEAQHPYDTFHYYFLRASSLSADREVLEGTREYEWRVNFYNGKLWIDCGDITYTNEIDDQDLLDKMLASMKVTEDIQADTSTANPCAELAEAIAEKIGSCQVVDNVIYYLNNDFEIWNGLDSADADWEEVEYGIFLIIEVLPNVINAYVPKVETCADVDNIGKKPLDYYTSEIQFDAHSVNEFITKMDIQYGNEWFATYDEEEDFIDTYGPLMTGANNEK